MIEYLVREDVIRFFNNSKLYKYLRIDDPEKIPKDLLQQIEEYKNQIIDLINPVVIFTEFNSFETVEQGIKINDIIVKSKVLSKISLKATSIYIFILTISSKVEDKIKEYLVSNSLFAAQVIDAYGSVYVDAFADLFMNNIESDISKNGYLLSARYSPGYCDINISEQQNLFDLLKTENNFVILSESFQMFPEKSISGFIFKMRKEVAIDYKKHFIFCSECPMKECKYYMR